MKFEELTEFKRDVRKLSKKYRTIASDIDTVIQILEYRPNQQPPFSYRIDNLRIETCVIKIKKIASKSFKGKGIQSGFRLIYAYFEEEERIVLIEIYHKSNKENEDRERILKHFK